MERENDGYLVVETVDAGIVEICLACETRDEGLAVIRLRQWGSLWNGGK